VEFLLLVLITLLIVVLVKYNKTKKLLSELKKQNESLSKDNHEMQEILKPIIDLKKVVNDLSGEKTTLTITVEMLKQQKESILKELDILKSDINSFDFGFYEFHYDFASSETYKLRLNTIREMQKELGKNNDIIHTSISYTSESQKYIKDVAKLMIRLFNCECDYLFDKIKFNNVLLIEEKLNKLKETVNKFGKLFNCSLNNKYIDLKIEELRLIYEYQEKLETEKEEQRAIKEQIREEEKARKDAERAEREAASEAKRYQELLDKAREELSIANAEQTYELNLKIIEIQKQLEEANLMRERAISLAQQTKTGHVYIISNIGSFGENVYKIGMTRRLEPMDRVNELGDASVPFEFDVHAMIPSKDAPALENLLHQKFKNMRVNKVNERKEFFRVTLNDIEKVVQDNGFNIEFTKIAQAKQFRESLSISKEHIN